MNLRAQSLLAVGLFALLITQQASQRVDQYHVLPVCFLGIALLPIALGAFFSRSQAAPSPTRLLLCVLLSLALVVGIRPASLRYAREQIARAFGARQDDATFVSRGDRSFPIASKQLAAFTQALVDYVANVATPGQRLFVGPSDLRRTNHNAAFIYHLLPELTPATYFIEMNPLSANRPNSRLATDVQSAHWLILDHRWNGWKEPNASQWFGPETPEQVILEHFELEAKVGDYDLFRRKDVTPRSS
ncbi:MAG TPA: hypothetical protein VM940_02030 [Chthoniobacterales bacterium]|nr:hypothetical protein [Chthoniobacterales bacterium]